MSVSSCSSSDEDEDYLSRFAGITAVVDQLGKSDTGGSLTEIRANGDRAAVARVLERKLDDMLEYHEVCIGNGSNDDYFEFPLIKMKDERVILISPGSVDEVVVVDDVYQRRKEAQMEMIPNKRRKKLDGETAAPTEDEEERFRRAEGVVLNFKLD